MVPSPPDRFETERLVLRRWRPADAPSIKAAIDSSLPHLQAWVSWAMGEPTPLADMEARLAGFSAAFDAGREWIYGVFSPDEREALGGIGFHPRSDAPDCVELGYWLRADATGRGYVTEAARAAMVMARALPGIRRLEIRCDPHNERSAAVPRRLGFQHVRTLENDTLTPDGRPRDTMVWEYVISRP
jgi:RimJ/RimL family protein N-acetyltransferase